MGDLGRVYHQLGQVEAVARSRWSTARRMCSSATVMSWADRALLRSIVQSPTRPKAVAYDSSSW